MSMTTDHDRLVTVATVANEMEGQLLVNILSEHGIRAVATGGFTAQFQAEAPGMVRVVVNQDNLENARSVLEERHRIGTSQPDVMDLDASAKAPRLTTFRFGIWGWLLLVVDLMVSICFLVSLVVGGNVMVGVVALLIIVALTAIILTRSWSIFF